MRFREILRTWGPGAETREHLVQRDLRLLGGYEGEGCVLPGNVSGMTAEREGAVPFRNSPPFGDRRSRGKAFSRPSLLSKYSRPTSRGSRIRWVEYRCHKVTLVLGHRNVTAGELVGLSQGLGMWDNLSLLSVTLCYRTMNHYKNAGERSASKVSADLKSAFF